MRKIGSIAIIFITSMIVFSCSHSGFIFFTKDVYHLSVNNHSNLSMESKIFFPPKDELSYSDKNSSMVASMLQISFEEAMINVGFDITYPSDELTFGRIITSSGTLRADSLNSRIDSLSNTVPHRAQLSQQVDRKNRRPKFYEVSISSSVRNSSLNRYKCTSIKMKIYELETMRTAALGYFTGKESCDKVAQNLVEMLSNKLDSLKSDS